MSDPLVPSDLGQLLGRAAGPVGHHQRGPGRQATCTAPTPRRRSSARRTAAPGHRAVPGSARPRRRRSWPARRGRSPRPSGRPVDPEVKITYAGCPRPRRRLSGAGAGGRQARQPGIGPAPLVAGSSSISTGVGVQPGQGARPRRGGSASSTGRASASMNAIRSGGITRVHRQERRARLGHGQLGHDDSADRGSTSATIRSGPAPCDQQARQLACPRSSSAKERLATPSREIPPPGRRGSCRCPRPRTAPPPAWRAPPTAERCRSTPPSTRRCSASVRMSSAAGVRRGFGGDRTPACARRCAEIRSTVGRRRPAGRSRTRGSAVALGTPRR